MMSNLEEVFCKVDWTLLAKQKRALLALAYGDNDDDINGLLNFLDAVQDAAEKDHFPVVFLTEAEGT